MLPVIDRNDETLKACRDSISDVLVVDNETSTPRVHEATVSSGDANYSKILRQLEEVYQGDDEEDERASWHAFEKTLRIISETTVARVGAGLPALPRGLVTTDGKGGVRIEWTDTGDAVYLAVSGQAGGRDYIYHDIDDEYGVEENVTGSTLARWLRILD